MVRGRQIVQRQLDVHRSDSLQRHFLSTHSNQSVASCDKELLDFCGCIEEKETITTGSFSAFLSHEFLQEIAG